MSKVLLGTNVAFHRPAALLSIFNLSPTSACLLPTEIKLATDLILITLSVILLLTHLLLLLVLLLVLLPTSTATTTTMEIQ